VEGLVCVCVRVCVCVCVCACVSVFLKGGTTVRSYRGARSAPRFCMKSVKIGQFSHFSYRRPKSLRSGPAGQFPRTTQKSRQTLSKTLVCVRALACAVCVCVCVCVCVLDALDGLALLPEDVEERLGCHEGKAAAAAVGSLACGYACVCACRLERM
jgi:hypothetical protein